jgi:hypothetical protein
MDASVFYKVPFSHLKNSFAKLGHFGVSEPNGFLQENIKPTFLYHAGSGLKSFLTLAYWYTKIFSLDNQYRRVPFFY